MPRPGGESDKVGLRYEQAWTADAMLDVIVGRAATISIEPLEEGKGVEFVSTVGGGLSFFHTCKRQQARREWSLSDLTRKSKSANRSILGDLAEKLLRSTNNHAVFVSSTGANELRELTERAMRFLDHVSFDKALASSAILQRKLRLQVAPLFHSSIQETFACLSRLRVVLISEHELLRRVDERCMNVLQPRDHFGPDWGATARLHLTELALERLGTCWSREALSAELAKRGFVRRDSNSTVIADRDDVRSQPIELLRPTELSRNASHFLYWTRAIKFSGRSEELADLQEFAADQRKLLWWLWCGHGGTGKSRLALELCHQLQSVWAAGFLPSVWQLDQLRTWRPDRPTFVVIDYCSSRARQVGDAILVLASRRLEYPVRLLLLERERSGAWWPELLHHDSSQDHHRISGIQFDEPRELVALSRGALWEVALSIFTAAGTPPPKDRDAFLSELESIDPLRRPLFAALAADALAHGTKIRQWNKEQLVESVLHRERARWHLLLTNAAIPARAIGHYFNMIGVATLLGGLSLGEVPDVLGLDKSGMLPDRLTFDISTYRQLVPTAPSNAGLGALEPDILGEAFVLDSVRSNTTGQWPGLVQICWAAKPDATASFLTKAATDFPTDAALEGILALDALGVRARYWWSIVFVSTAAALAVHNEKLFVKLKQRLIVEVGKHPTQAVLSHNLGLGIFEAGLRALATGHTELALELFMEGRALPRVPRAVTTEMDYHCGLAMCALGRSDQAIAVFADVMRDATAAADTRSRAMQNWAVLKLRVGQRASAIEALAELHSATWAPTMRRMTAMDLMRDVESLPEGEQSPTPLQGPSPGFVDSSGVPMLLETTAGFERYYPTLLRIARGHIARSHDMEPEELVHEVYVRVLRSSDRYMLEPDVFLRVASRAMMYILIDRARHLARGPRQERVRVELLDLQDPADPKSLPGGEGLDLLDMDAALQELEARDPRARSVIDMRMAGFSWPEIAQALGVSSRSVDRMFSFARAWLHARMRGK